MPYVVLLISANARLYFPTAKSQKRRNYRLWYNAIRPNLYLIIWIKLFYVLATGLKWANNGIILDPPIKSNRDYYCFERAHFPLPR